VILWFLQESKKHSKKNKGEKEVVNLKQRFLNERHFWNGRGLSDLAKHPYIFEVVKDLNLDFFAVMETNKTDNFK
jgi:hypothetical protein